MRHGAEDRRQGVRGVRRYLNLQSEPVKASDREERVNLWLIAAKETDYGQGDHLV